MMRLPYGAFLALVQKSVSWRSCSLPYGEEHLRLWFGRPFGGPHPVAVTLGGRRVQALGTLKSVAFEDSETCKIIN